MERNHISEYQILDPLKIQISDIRPPPPKKKSNIRYHAFAKSDIWLRKIRYQTPKKIKYHISRYPRSTPPPTMASVIGFSGVRYPTITRHAIVIGHHGIYDRKCDMITLNPSFADVAVMLRSFGSRKYCEFTRSNS